MSEIDDSHMKFDVRFAFVELRRLIRSRRRRHWISAGLFIAFCRPGRDDAARRGADQRARLRNLDDCFFVGHRYFTFRATGNIRAQIFKFALEYGLGLLTTVAITALVVDVLGWPYGAAILFVGYRCSAAHVHGFEVGGV